MHGWIGLETNLIMPERSEHEALNVCRKLATREPAHSAEQGLGMHRQLILTILRCWVQNLACTDNGGVIPANPASFPVKFHREHCPDDDKDNLTSSGTHSDLSSAFPSHVSAAKMNGEKMEYGNVTYIYCKSETSNEGQK